MTIAQIIVAYSVCWWLMLFMVLPHQVAPVKNPQTGNAPSAPANPQIRKKCIWATLLAVLPTLLIYFVATNAKAADEAIYHASSHGCHASATYRPSSDLAIRDAAADSKVASADLPGTGSDLYTGDINIPIEIPSANYTNPATHNVDLSQSFIDAGRVTVTKRGNTLLNGKPISDNGFNTGDCSEDN